MRWRLSRHSRRLLTLALLAMVLALGGCLLALGAAAALLPVASSGAGSAILHVLAVVAVIAAAILVLPG